jgi:integrase
MATLRKRKGQNGRNVWQVQIVRRGFPPQYRTFNTRDQAESWARVTEAQMDQGLWHDRSEGDRTLLREALVRYEQEITPRKASQQPERSRIRMVSGSFLGGLALSRITGRDVADYIRDRQAGGASAHTVRLDLSLLSHLYSVARSAWGMEYLVNPVPLAKLARPKIPRGRERRLLEGEEEKLLRAASPVFGAVIRWALATAMRRGEIANLRWEHVDRPRRSVLLPETKNGETRSVPLSPAALAVLESLPRRIDGSVFGLTGNAIRLTWRRTVTRAGITGLRFHDLRHEAISRLFEETDLDVMEIRAISGHKTLQMLARYTHLRTHRLADRLAGKGRIGP